MCLFSAAMADVRASTIVPSITTGTQLRPSFTTGVLPSTSAFSQVCGSPGCNAGTSRNRPTLLPGRRLLSPFLAFCGCRQSTRIDARVSGSARSGYARLRLRIRVRAHMNAFGFREESAPTVRAHSRPRVQVTGTCCPKKDAAHLVGRVACSADSTQPPPSTLEAAALWIRSRRRWRLL
jgi:hypothetical protein